MNFWRLVSPNDFSTPALVSHHSHWLCVAAILLAVLSAWVLLPVIQRYHYGNPRHRALWMVVGGVGMGVGIWAMHFTAMLAYSLPIKIEYDLLITSVSIVPAILASMCCIHLYQPENPSFRRYHLAALALALGVGSMHYVGMEAIVVAADMYYQPEWFVISLLAAYLLAAWGLRAHRYLSQHPRLPHLPGLLIGSVLLGIAVSSMHFIAMKATYFQASIPEIAQHMTIPPYGMILIIITCTLLLLGMIAIGVLVDQRFDHVATSLHHSEMRFKQLAESTQTAIFTFDPERIHYANPALSQITGYDSEELRILPLSRILGEEFYQFVQEILETEIPSGEVYRKQCRVTTSEGNKHWLYFSLTLAEFDDSPMGLASAVDISDQKRAEANLRSLAYTDPLTQLSNRARLMDRLSHHLTLLKRRERGCHSCLMLLDLNGFKAINDIHGHQQGDLLLTRLGLRLRNFCRESDTVARLGGDEFIILFEDVQSYHEIPSIAERLLSHLCRPVELGRGPIDIHISIGVLELQPGLYSTPDEALRDVDIAMYRAKETNGPSWTLFDEALDQGAQRERQLMGELKSAIAESELELHYQPIVDARNGTVVGFESLARWQRSNGEWVSPAEFIPLAETMGLVSDIGLWATSTAASQLGAWNQLLQHKDLYISINLAPVSFSDERLLTLIEDACKHYELSSGQLRLELTERMLMSDTNAMLNRLDQLLALGCEIMIDDFGTGYSSLSYLHRLPISTLKIDRSFILSLEDGESARSIITTIVGLANNLDMKVISEGVENAGQVYQLMFLGCHIMQGFHFSRPLPAQQAEEYLLDHLPKKSEALSVTTSHR